MENLIKVEAAFYGFRYHIYVTEQRIYGQSLTFGAQRKELFWIRMVLNTQPEVQDLRNRLCGLGIELQGMGAHEAISLSSYV